MFVGFKTKKQSVSRRDTFDIASIRSSTVLWASSTTSDDLNDPELAHSKTHLPFDNQVISFTGITWEKPALTDKLRAMGVRAIHLDLTLDATALISWGHDSLKYEVCVQYPLIITSLPPRYHTFDDEADITLILVLLVSSLAFCGV